MAATRGCRPSLRLAQEVGSHLSSQGRILNRLRFSARVRVTTQIERRNFKTLILPDLQAIDSQIVSPKLESFQEGGFQLACRLLALCGFFYVVQHFSFFFVFHKQRSSKWSTPCPASLLRSREVREAAVCPLRSGKAALPSGRDRVTRLAAMIDTPGLVRPLWRDICGFTVGPHRGHQLRLRRSLGNGNADPPLV